jgi:hypothetical protein
MGRKPAATVCIPWRPSPSRMKPYDRVREFWAKNFPTYPVITADSDTEIFSLSQARNNAVRQAETEVVIVADADTLAPVAGVKAAVKDPTGVIWPHMTWRLIPAEYAERPFKDFPTAPTVIEYKDGLGGVMVTTTKEYWRLGGQPEEFLGWGCEDCAWQMVVSTLSIFRREPGIAYSIDHNDAGGNADTPGWSRDGNRNLPMLAPYRAAAGRPWLMREIIRKQTDPIKVALENDPLAGRYQP